MADIRFTGFVEEWTKNNPQHPDWGMRVSEPHSKKDGDKWVTVARTYRTVKAAYEVQLDFSQYNPGDRVEVIGTELTETNERDGKTYSNLVVKAQQVTLVKAASGGSAVQGGNDWGNAAAAVAAIGGTPVQDETPF